MTQKKKETYWAPEMKIGSIDSRQEAESAFFDAHVSLVAHPRYLMAQLRDIMASAGHAKEKLNKIMKLTATHLQTDVCSCYILRENSELELFATVGLQQESVNKTKLKLGEGLVGSIAAHACPLSLADARSNPNFVSCEGTGEEDFMSFCGVPILRSQKMRGVLVIQNKKKRHYGEDIIEMLQTVGMIVASLIMSGELISRQELNTIHARRDKPGQLNGVGLSPGISVGHAVLYSPVQGIKDIVSENPDTEKARLKKAISHMHKSIDSLVVKTEKRKDADKETLEILETYQMFSKDKGWLKRIEAAVDKGLSAEAAVQKVKNDMHIRMSQLEDEYMRERLHDLEDLSNRLLMHLLNADTKLEKKKRPKKIVLVARSMGPAALLDYDPKTLKAVLLESGSTSGHVAIVARAMGIPVIGQCGEDLLTIAEGDQIIVDADHKIAYINPSEYIFELYSHKMANNKKYRKIIRKNKNKPSITKDGKEISLYMNAGLIIEMPLMRNSGAQGIGLYRTELSFMGWSKYPRVALQAELYGRIMDQAGDLPVTFRTLDIGGDKPLPYFKAPEEENPALGWRAIRIALDRPAILRTQVRAFIMGAKGRNLKILLPLVSEVAELDRARELIEMEKERARKRDMILPEKIEIGVMLEVPSLVWQLDSLLKDVDFLAVGTNDLMQYLFAADGRSDSTRHRYDVLSPPMLNMLKVIADKSKKAGVPVSVCGEMASDPLGAMVLVALGFEKLSMNAQSIGVIKSMINSLDTTKLQPYLRRLLKSREHSLRSKLQHFARDYKIHIGSIL